MENIIKSFATIGLGRIGGNLALHASEKGYDVIGVNRHEMPEFLQGSSIKHTNEIEDLAKLLPHPRLVFLYIPAGKAIDAILDQLINEVLEEGDIIVDGGNSYWGDSVRRAKKVEDTRQRNKNLTEEQILDRKEKAMVRRQSTKGYNFYKVNRHQ